MTEEDRF